MVSKAEAVVQVEGLVKSFKTGLGLRRKQVLHGVHFSVRRGELFGFVGPNGAGKTTTLKTLVGLIQATQGDVRILGKPVQDVDVHRYIGFSPEAPCFYDYLTGFETIAFFARLSGMKPSFVKECVARTLREVGLHDAAGARLRTYSKGMLQRISIAQALVHDPEVIFLDEPMSGLDPVGRKEMRDLIAGLHARGKTIVMSTHILSDVESLCDRVAIIVNGSIGYEGSIHNLQSGHDRYVDLHCLGLPTEYAEELTEKNGYEIRGSGEHLSIRLPEKDASDVLQAVLSRGARVTEFVPERLGLEDVFLNVVGAKGESGGAQK